VSFRDELDPQRAQIMRAVRHASDGWAVAMRSHKLAPPDAAFARRLRALSDAAAAEQIAWEHAAPPYELRPDTGRRGPAELWARFDAAVAALNAAITGSDAAKVADAFGEMSEAAGALADAVAQEDLASAPSRARGAA
jgi:hypothetical protein